ncbi:MAG: hypothetical protein APF84_02420 [Gracilibacter sp. BRH_c7a]|nr:MAG: hypothetical protein APF84_02420 [Gracilibacter sp. BRH_c7a]
MSDLQTGNMNNVQLNLGEKKRYMAPPNTWRGVLTFIGPGAVLAALAVGGGELVMNPRAGAMFGFALAWLVLMGLFFKYFITSEIGRYPIVSGGNVLDSWARMHPALPITFDIAALVARGVSVAGNGLTLGTILFWAFPNTISHASWAILMTIVSGIILYIGLYNVLEKISLVMVGIMIIAVVICAVAVMTAQTWGEFFTGLVSIGKIPSGSLKDALPLLGWSGEGAIGTILYAAWLQERGHGIKVGNNVTKDTKLSEQEIKDGKSWLRVMKTDLSISFVIQGLACFAFMIAGAVILRPLGIVPEGSSLATEQARLFTEVLGPWAQQLFILGAAAAMFTTLMVAIDCETRIGQDLFKRLKKNVMQTEADRIKVYRGFLIFSVIITVIFSKVAAPLTLLKFGAVFDGVILLPIAGYLTYRANKKFIPEALQSKGAWAAITLLGIGVLSIFAVLALVYLY